MAKMLAMVLKSIFNLKIASQCVVRVGHLINFEQGETCI